MKTKRGARYRIATVNRENCHNCVHIVLHGQEPATCELVEGTVDRQHVCDLFRSR